MRHANGEVTLVQVKSAAPSNLEGQLRLGLGQVLRFTEGLYARGIDVKMVIARELGPASAEWKRLLQRLRLRLVTPRNLADAFCDHESAD